MTRGNATLAANELGLQIRQLCPFKGVKSWKKIDQSIKDAVVQAVLDKFDIGEDFHTDEQAQEIVDRKAYLLYKDWRYNLMQYFLELEEEGVDDPCSYPPTGVCLEDWKHMIDVAWKDESHLKRLKAGKANRSMLPYNHTSGSRSFPMSNMVRMESWIFRNFMRNHTSRKRLMNGFIPNAVSYILARARDKHMEAMRAKMEVLCEERGKDHEELMKEKEERWRDREEMIREREEMMKQVEEGKKAREEMMEEVEEGKKSKGGATKAT
ncbi:hypothetical protein ACSBR1_005784 [Camellia fascicularis]